MAEPALTAPAIEAESHSPRRDPFIRRHLMSNAKTLAAVVLAWSIVAVIATTTAFIAIRGDSLSTWLRIFGPMVTYYAVWVAVSLAIYRLVETFSGSAATQLLGVAAHVVLFLVVAVSLPFIVHSDDWRTWLYGDRAAGFHTLAAVIYLLNLTGSFLIRFYRLSVQKDREARDARLRSSLLENQLNLARMDALKMQINPHFLFNALNSIAALIETNRNVEAYDTTELLGGLLRSALDQSSERLLPLEQELEFVRRYVDVEKVRFGSRISFETDIDPDCSQYRVPALVLQPMIENSIKYALNGSAAAVTIDVRARRDGELLLVELSDNGPGLAGNVGNSGGYGLKNVRKRLELLYDDAATLDVANRPTGGVRVTLRIPLAATHRD